MNKEIGKKQKRIESKDLNDQETKRRKREVLKDENLDMRTRELLHDIWESSSMQESEQRHREFKIKEDLKRLHVENATLRMNYEKQARKYENEMDELRRRLNFLNEAVGVDMFLKISKSIREEINTIELKINNKMNNETEKMDQIIQKLKEQTQNTSNRIMNIENNAYTLIKENQNEPYQQRVDIQEQEDQEQNLNNQYNNPIFTEQYLLPL